MFSPRILLFQTQSSEAAYNARCETDPPLHHQLPGLKFKPGCWRILPQKIDWKYLHNLEQLKIWILPRSTSVFFFLHHIIFPLVSRGRFPFIKWISSWSSHELKLRALPSYTTISDHINPHQDSRPRNFCTRTVLSATSNHAACSPCKMLLCNHGKICTHSGLPFPRRDNQTTLLWKPSPYMWLPSCPERGWDTSSSPRSQSFRARAMKHIGKWATLQTQECVSIQHGRSLVAWHKQGR